MTGECAILVNLDQEKAFDCVDRCFFYIFLEATGLVLIFVIGFLSFMIVLL